jgi:hypothetical protein
MEAILSSHLPPETVEPSLMLLTGGVLIRVAFQGRSADLAFIEDLVDRVLVSCIPGEATRPTTSRPEPSA